MSNVRPHFLPNLAVCPMLCLALAFGLAAGAHAAWARNDATADSTFPASDLSYAKSGTSAHGSAQPVQGDGAVATTAPAVPSLTVPTSAAPASQAGATTPTASSGVPTLTVPATAPADTTAKPVSAVASRVAASVSGSAPTTSSAPAISMAATPTANGISIPAPPPPASLTNDAAQLAAQAEQAAIQAQAEAEATQLKQEEDHNRKSFKKAEMGLLPMSSDQVRGFMHRLEDTQEAAQPPSTGQPHGKVRITTLSLDPGTDPPLVNLAAGYVTTINMLDASGEPWPILDVGVGGNFEVSPTQAGSHVVRIMPLTRYGAGNLSVLLKDLPTPIIFRLSAATNNVDLRLDARIPKYGPNAKMPLVNRPRLEAGDDVLMNILQNNPPAEAHRMKVSGIDARSSAWSVGDHVYVRTPLSLLSPSWNASVASADGTTVYDIGNAPVLLMSDNGAVVRAHLSQDSDHDR